MLAAYYARKLNQLPSRIRKEDHLDLMCIDIFDSAEEKFMKRKQDNEKRKRTGTTSALK